MAGRTLQVSNKTGVSAAALVVVLIVAALLAVLSRAEAGAWMGRSDLAVVRFTVWQAILSSVISVFCAIPVARAFARRQFVGRGVLVTLLGAPFILPVVVAVFGLLAVFGGAGWLNTVLFYFGIPPVSIYGLHGVVLAHVFFNMPLATRLLLQGWQSIPAERFRLSAQLHLTPRAVFRTLEVPMLRQVVPGVAALIFVICLSSFAVALTLGGGPKATTIELAIYEAFQFSFDLSRAATLSVIQLVLAGSAAVFALWFISPISLGGGLDRPVRRWDVQGSCLRIWDGFVIVTAASFLLFPMAAVVLRGVKGLSKMPDSVWQAAGVSIIMALASVVIMCVLMLPMAGWIASRRSGAVEAIGLLGLSASPLMIGTGWLILLYPVMNPSTIGLPVTALVNALMALPFALRIIVPRLRETLQTYGAMAQMLDLRGWSLWRYLLLPRLRPQLGFATGLTAALSVGDLGVITIFAVPDRTTLPMQMYRLMGAYRMDAAAGAALLLLALALGLFWIFDRGGRWHAET